VNLTLKGCENTRRHRRTSKGLDRASGAITKMIEAQALRDAANDLKVRRGYNNKRDIVVWLYARARRLMNEGRECRNLDAQPLIPLLME
jgi:hypothetical protein